MAGEKILFISPNDYFISKIKKEILTKLENKGYKIFIKKNLKNSIEIIENEKIDVVLICLSEAEKNIVKKIKQIRFKTEIIALIASDNKDLILKSINDGSFNYITKPFDSDLIEINIEKAINKIKIYNFFNNIQHLLKDSIENKIKSEIDLPKYILRSAIHNVIMIIDNEKRITTYNEGAKRILGYKNEYLSKSPYFQEFFYKKDYEKLNTAFAKTFVYGEYSFELNWKSKTGEAISISSEMYILKDENSEPIGYLIIGFDISHQKKLQSQISHAEKLATIGKIAAGVAHEINNPIASISACAQSLLKLVEDNKEETFDEPVFSRYLKIITEQAFRCKNIIDNLLDYSRQNEAKVSNINLEELMKDAIELTIHQVKKDFVKVSIQSCGDVNNFKGDPNKIKQLFVNILSNAIDAISEKQKNAKIEIKFSVKNSKIVIQVKDNGNGIDEKYVKKVFDPFFTTKGAGEGTGLGLSICKEIIDMHGGEITFKSKPGEYTTVTVFLPKEGIKNNGKFLINANI